MSISRHLSGVIAELIDRPRYLALVQAHALAAYSAAKKQQRKIEDSKATKWKSASSITFLSSLSCSAAFVIEAIGIELFSAGMQKPIFFTGVGAMMASVLCMQALGRRRQTSYSIGADQTNLTNSSKDLFNLHDKLTSYRSMVALSTTPSEPATIAEKVAAYHQDVQPVLNFQSYVLRSTPVSYIQQAEAQVARTFFDEEKTAYERLGLDPAFALRPEA